MNLRTIISESSATGRPRDYDVENEEKEADLRRKQTNREESRPMLQFDCVMARTFFRELAPTPHEFVPAWTRQ